MSNSSQQIIDQNKEIYNKIAEHFSDTRSFLWRDLEPLSQFVKDGDTVLDIGCGNGRLYQLFGEMSRPEGMQNIRFVGVDISDKLIDIAKKEYPKGEFYVGDMVELSFENEKFDVVYSLVAFHHLPDHNLQIKALQEMKRVLKPGGKIILLNWNAYSDWVNKKLEKGDYEDLGNQLFRVPWKTGEGEKVGDRIYYGFTLEELEKITKEAGLKLEDQYYLRHGERVGVEQGMNIVSVIGK
jgi:tRNA (uracil-5-)-methyltransferase TRM9